MWKEFNRVICLEKRGDVARRGWDKLSDGDASLTWGGEKEEGRLGRKRREEGWS